MFDRTCKCDEFTRGNDELCAVCRLREPTPPHMKVGDKFTIAGNNKRRSFWQWLTREKPQLNLYEVLTTMTSKPDCFGSNPGAQAQSENDCQNCPYELHCLPRIDKIHDVRVGDTPVPPGAVHTFKSTRTGAEQKVTFPACKHGYVPAACHYCRDAAPFFETTQERAQAEAKRVLERSRGDSLQSAAPDDHRTAFNTQTRKFESAFDKQEGGDHYRGMKSQPFAFVRDNQIGHAEGEAIYRLLRWRDKGGIADLKKVIHTVELIIEYEERRAK